MSLTKYNNSFVQSGMDFIRCDGPFDPPEPPEPTEEVSVYIGTGTDASTYLPTYNYYRYSLSNQIYAASEIGYTGKIKSISFFPTGTCANRNLRIYMMHCQETSFPNTVNIPVSDADLVYSGSVSFSANVETVVELTNQFDYNGTDNLLLAVDDKTGTWDSGISFMIYTPTATSGGIHVYTDNSPYDARISPQSQSMTQRSYKNQIRLVMLVPVVEPVFPTKNFFKLTNLSNTAHSIVLYSGTKGDVFLSNKTYLTSFSSREATTISIPAKKTIVISGLTPVNSADYPMISDETTTGSITIDRFNDTITNMSYAFTGWESLTNIRSWVGFDNVTNIRGAFSGCTGLITTAKQWTYFENVEDVKDAFMDCTAWTSDAYSLYEYLANKEIVITNHENTFKECRQTIGWTDIPYDWRGINPDNPLDLPSKTFRLQMIDSSVDPTSWYTSSSITWDRVDGTDDTWDCHLNIQSTWWDGLFQNKTELLKVLGANTTGFTSMAGWFHGCTSLVYVERFDTSSVTRMFDMFRGCSVLTAVPFLNTGRVTTMERMFSGCSALTTVPLYDTGNVTNMYGMFSSCKSLITIPAFNTSKVTTMASMFYYCLSLAEVPYMDTSRVTTMNQMFSHCYSLTTIPQFNTSNVTDMSYMFGNYPTSDGDQSSLVTVPLLDTSSVTTMTYMFAGCKSLTSVPLFNTESLTDMSYMFAGCISLHSVPLLNTSNVTTMNATFSACTALQTVPLFDTSNVTDMGAMFYMGRGITAYQDAALSSVPKFNTSKVTTMSYMFSGCVKLNTVPLFDTSNVTDMSGMFSMWRYSLTSSSKGPLSIPHFDTSKVTNMYAMFSMCAYLTSIPLFDTANVTTMQEMCYICQSLTSIPTFNTSKVTNMKQAFYICGKVNSGALDLYAQASTQATPPSEHTQCFYQCGYLTTTGAAELAQIPSDWK